MARGMTLNRVFYVGAVVALIFLTFKVFDHTSGKSPPAWLWPTQKKEVSIAGVRLGRVLHWLSFIAAPLIFIGAVVTGFTYVSDYQDIGNALSYPFIGAISAFATILVGRAARYLFGAE